MATKMPPSARWLHSQNGAKGDVIMMKVLRDGNVCALAALGAGLMLTGCQQTAPPAASAPPASSAPTSSSTEHDYNHNGNQAV